MRVYCCPYKRGTRIDPPWVCNFFDVKDDHPITAENGFPQPTKSSNIYARDKSYRTASHLNYFAQVVHFKYKNTVLASAPMSIALS